MPTENPNITPTLTDGPAAGRRIARHDTGAAGFSFNLPPVRILAITLSLIVSLASVAYAAASVHHLFSEYVGLAGV